jgi:hypothetical protein
MKYHPAKTLDAVEVSLVKSLLAAIGVNHNIRNALTRTIEA